MSTPTTVQVRAAWASFREASRDDSWTLPFAQFDRWLAEVKAEAKAEALREAADEITSRLNRYGDAMTSNGRQGYYRTADLLYARAEQITDTP